MKMIIIDPEYQPITLDREIQITIEWERERERERESMDKW